MSSSQKVTDQAWVSWKSAQWQSHFIYRSKGIHAPCCHISWPISVAVGTKDLSLMSFSSCTFRENRWHSARYLKA